MKATLIHHSGVLVELSDKVLLFDYWKGDFDFPKDKPRYIFISHGHHDHFNPKVLDMHGTLIADRGINELKNKPVTLVESGDVIHIDDLKISVYGSTDEGVSFMVDTEGKRIFHSGDLNDWHWKDESTQEEIDQAKEYFKTELDMIPVVPIDLAMFPVDRRMGSDFDDGAHAFMNRFHPRYFLPIHFSAHPEGIEIFVKNAGVTDTTILRVDINPTYEL